MALSPLPQLGQGQGQVVKDKVKDKREEREEEDHQGMMELVGNQANSLTAAEHRSQIENLIDRSDLIWSDWERKREREKERERVAKHISVSIFIHINVVHSVLPLSLFPVVLHYCPVAHCTFFFVF